MAINTIWKKKEDLDSINKFYELTVPYEIFANWASTHQTKAVNGFRPGKAPISKFKEEWIRSYTYEIVAEIVETEKIENLNNYSYITDDFEENKPIKIDLILELKMSLPSINFCELEIDSPKANIIEADVQRSIKNWQSNHYKEGAVKEITAKNDFIELKAIVIEEEIIDEAPQSIHLRIGENKFIPEIEEKLIGKRINEFVEHEFIKENTNQKNTLKLIIQSIKEGLEFTIEDALNQFQVKSEKELNEIFKTKLIEEAEVVAEYKTLNQIREKIYNLNFDIPFSMAQKEYELVKSKTLHDLNCKEENAEEVIKQKLDLSLEQFSAKLEAMARNNCRLMLILHDFAKKEEITLTNEEISQEIDKHARYFQNKVEESRKFFADNENSLALLKRNLLEYKTIKAIALKVKLINKQVTLEELYK